MSSGVLTAERPRIAFERYLGRELDVFELAKQLYPNVSSDYIRNKLGPTKLYEADADAERILGKLAMMLISRTDQRPDIIIACSSYLPSDAAEQNIAGELRRQLSFLDMADGRSTPENTKTVSAACSSFVVALDWLRKLDPRGANVLIDINETGYRRTLSPNPDTSKSHLLFSDAAVALQFYYGEGLYVRASEFEHLPQYRDYLRMPVPLCNADDPHILAYPPAYGEHFFMDGPKLVKIFERKIPVLLHNLLSKNRISKEDLKFLLTHQSSIRMVDGFNGRYNVRYRSEGIRKYGNTSSASIPLDMEDGIKSGQIKRGDEGIVVGYGGGLTCGAAVVKVG